LVLVGVFLIGSEHINQRAMPKSISGTQTGKNAKPEANFLISINKLNEDGSLSYDALSNFLKENIQMAGASFADGTPQDLYFPLNTPKHTGKFKRMAIILEECWKRGDLGPVSKTVLKKKNAECPKFKCSDPNSGTCCMCRMLFNQPDFAVVKSCLEVMCTEFHVTVLFLPKFHYELNPIEMVWGYEKRLYCLNPESSREDVLERNSLAVLDQVLLESMCQFVIRVHRFANAYRQGLDGPQAAWAARKYKGHRILPLDFRKEMEAAGILRGGNPSAGL
jgi:hypothetical protein